MEIEDIGKGIDKWLCVEVREEEERRKIKIENYE